MVFWVDGEMLSVSYWDIGVICLLFVGQEVCGDVWVIFSGFFDLVIMVLDGLGYGVDVVMVF